MQDRLDSLLEKLNKDSLTSKLIYLFTAFIIFDCNTVYSLSSAHYRLSIFVMGFEGLLLLTLWKKIDKVIFNNWCVSMIPYAAIVLLYAVLNVSLGHMKSYTLRFIMFIPLAVLIFMALAKEKKSTEVFIAYENLMIIMGVLSVLLWFFAAILDVVPITNYVNVYWGTEYDYPMYLWLLTKRQTIELAGVSIFRNQFFFVEGPMYNLCLLVALVIELFIRPVSRTAVHARIRFDGKKYRIVKKLGSDFSFGRCLILVSVIVSTLTTTGIIMCIMLCALKLLIWVLAVTKNNRELQRLIIASVMALSGVTVFFFMSKKLGSDSWAIRLDDYIAGFLSWKDAPLIGHGYNNIESLKSYYDMSIRKNLGFSNAMFVVLSQGGLLLFSVYAAGILGWVKGCKKHIEHLLCAVSFFLLFATTLFHDSFLMMMVISYGIYKIFNNFTSFSMQSFAALKLREEKE